MPQHLIARGNNRSALFFHPRDRLTFLGYLADACADSGCDVHAFVLMTNHVHLLATGNAKGSISSMMQDIGRRYAQYVNSAYERTGTLYEGRFKSSLVETSGYFLACMRYIELNPVRAGLVRTPGEHPWSSFGQNASGEPTGLVKPHSEYLQLGSDPRARGAAYLRLFEETIDERTLTQIRESAQMNRALGSDVFLAALGNILRRRVRVIPQGRPPKSQI